MSRSAVYVSSFWAKPYKPDTNHHLFETEKQALLYDMLYAVPLESLDRKVVCPFGVQYILETCIFAQEAFVRLLFTCVNRIMLFFELYSFIHAKLIPHFDYNWLVPAHKYDGFSQRTPPSKPTWAASNFTPGVANGISPKPVPRQHRPAQPQIASPGCLQSPVGLRPRC